MMSELEDMSGSLTPSKSSLASSSKSQARVLGSGQDLTGVPHQPFPIPEVPPIAPLGAG